MSEVFISYIKDKLDNLTNKQAYITMLSIGLVTYCTGLFSPFQGDDYYQIVNNIPVHSIKNLFLFFNSSTFFDGQYLTGTYYRPMMSTSYSILYSIFGAHSFPFHLAQLLIYISSAFILYLIFKRFFKPNPALVLAIIFLVHPMNSYVVFAIPTLQDALFFFFGILAIWFLIEDKYKNTNWLCAASLLLSLLSKETGIVFVIIALLYLLLFDKKRLRAFAFISIVPILVYLVLRLHAIGLNPVSSAAPIDKLSFAGRLLTMPSLISFYAAKFIFPWRLSTAYYWTYPAFSVKHVLVPLIVDILMAIALVYVGIIVHRKKPQSNYRAYLFFISWTLVGLVTCLQLLPLDMTASESWFYFSMAGLLGIVGVVLTTYKIHVDLKLLYVVVALLVIILAVRTLVRGTDYRNPYVLAQHDLSASQDNFSAMIVIAQELSDQGKYKEAAAYARQSIGIYPNVNNYTNLGDALLQTNDYPGAIAAFKHAMKYGSLTTTYEDLGVTYLGYGSYNNNIAYFKTSLKVFPYDYTLWMYLAILEDSHGDNKDAKIDISRAASLGPVEQALYSRIMENLPFTFDLAGNKTISTHP